MQFGDPGGTPTPDLGFRKALLYAAELRGHGGDLASWGDLKKGAAPLGAKKSAFAVATVWNGLVVKGS